MSEINEEQKKLAYIEDSFHSLPNEMQEHSCDIMAAVGNRQELVQALTRSVKFNGMCKPSTHGSPSEVDTVCRYYDLHGNSPHGH